MMRGKNYQNRPVFHRVGFIQKNTNGTFFETRCSCCMYCVILIFLERNCFRSASDLVNFYTFFRSVVYLSVVCLSHVCTLLISFDEFRRHAMWPVYS